MKQYNNKMELLDEYNERNIEEGIKDSIKRSSKPKDKYCECGKKAITREMCGRCYDRFWRRARMEKERHRKIIRELKDEKE